MLSHILPHHTKWAPCNILRTGAPTRPHDPYPPRPSILDTTQTTTTYENCGHEFLPDHFLKFPTSSILFPQLSSAKYTIQRKQQPTFPASPQRKLLLDAAMIPAGLSNESSPISRPVPVDPLGDGARLPPPTGRRRRFPTAARGDTFLAAIPDRLLIGERSGAGLRPNGGCPGNRSSSLRKGLLALRLLFWFLPPEAGVLGGPTFNPAGDLYGCSRGPPIRPTFKPAGDDCAVTK